MAMPRDDDYTVVFKAIADFKDAVRNTNTFAKSIDRLRAAQDRLNASQEAGNKKNNPSGSSASGQGSIIGNLNDYRRETGAIRGRQAALAAIVPQLNKYRAALDKLNKVESERNNIAKESGKLQVLNVDLKNLKREAELNERIAEARERVSRADKSTSARRSSRSGSKNSLAQEAADAESLAGAIEKVAKAEKASYTQRSDGGWAVHYGDVADTLDDIVSTQEKSVKVEKDSLGIARKRGKQYKVDLAQIEKMKEAAAAANDRLNNYSATASETTKSSARKLSSGTRTPTFRPTRTPAPQARGGGIYGDPYKSDSTMKQWRKDIIRVRAALDEVRFKDKDLLTESQLNKFEELRKELDRIRKIEFPFISKREFDAAAKDAQSLYDSLGRLSSNPAMNDTFITGMRDKGLISTTKSLNKVEQAEDSLAMRQLTNKGIWQKVRQELGNYHGALETVADTLPRLRREQDATTNSTRRSSVEFRKNGKAADNAGNSILRLANKIKNIRFSRKAGVGLPFVVGLVAGIAGLLGLVNPLIAGLGAAGSAALGFGNAIYQIAGAAYAVMPALGSLLTVVTTLAMAMGGVGSALSSGLNPRTGGGGGGGGGGGSRKAPTPIVVPTEELTYTEKVTRAYEDLRRAKEDAVWAQEDLNEAQKDAVKRLKELRLSVIALATAEKRSQANRQLSLENYANVMADPSSTRGDKMLAEVELEEAEQGIIDARQDSKDAVEELAKAEKEGVDGSRDVIMARRALTDANRAVRDSEIELSNTVREAGKVLNQAQIDAFNAAAGMGAIGGGIADPFAEAMAKLSPSAQKFVYAILDMADAWRQLKLEVQENFFSQFVDDVPKLTKLIPPLNTLLGETATVLGKITSDLINQVTSPEWLEDIGGFAEYNTPALENMGKALGSLLDWMRDITMAAGPFLVMLSEDFADAAAGWAEWAESFRENDAEQYFEDLHDDLERLWGIITDVGTVVNQLAQAARPFTDWLMDSLADKTKNWADAAREANTEGSEFQKFLENIKAPLSVVSDLMGNFFSWLGGEMSDTDNINQLTDILETLRDEIGPNLARVFDALADAELGPAIVDLAAALTDLLASVLENGGADLLRTIIDLLTWLVDVMADIADSPAGTAVIIGLGSALAGLLTLSGLAAILTPIFNVLKNISKLKFSSNLLNGLRGITGLGGLGAAGAGAGAGGKPKGGGTGTGPKGAGMGGLGIAGLALGGIIQSIEYAVSGSGKMTSGNTTAGIGDGLLSIGSLSGLPGLGVLGNALNFIGDAQSRREEKDRPNIKAPKTSTGNVSQTMKDFFGKGQQALSVPVNADTKPAVKSVNDWRRDTSNNPGNTKLNADGTPASNSLQEWLKRVRESPGKTKLTADGKPALTSLSDWRQRANNTKGTSVLGTFKGVADKAVDAWRAKADRTKGTSTLSARDNASPVVGGLQSSLNRLPKSKTTTLTSNTFRNVFETLTRTVTTNYRTLGTIPKGQGKNKGGEIQRRAAGGPIYRRAAGGSMPRDPWTVPGTGNGDTVNAMLTPGEFVMTKGATKRLGQENLSRLNSGMDFGELVGSMMQNRPQLGGTLGNDAFSTVPSTSNGLGNTPRVPTPTVTNNTNNSTDSGFHVENLNITNPVGETTDQSLSNTVRGIAYMRR